MKTLRPHQSRVPVYFKTAQVLRERIREGKYCTEEFLPAERDLAEELKVSRQTIRQAIDLLRQEGTVVPEQGRGTRIVAPNLLAGSVSSLPTEFQLTALIIYGISRESSAAICQGCTSVMRQADYHLIVAETMFAHEKRAADEAFHLRTLIDKGIRGIIIYAEPTARNRALLQEALERSIQVVQIDRFLPDVPCDYVGVDNQTATHDMVTHLIREGHRRIGFLSFQSEPSTCQERRQGAQKSAKTHAAEGAELLVGYLDEEKDLRAEVERCVREWIALPKPPTVLFAVNDELALIVMQVVRAQGLSIPENMAVVGFDNLRVGALVAPTLTTVQQPFAEIGATAARLLLDRMQGRYSGDPRQILLPTHLVIRQSDAFGKTRNQLSLAS